MRERARVAAVLTEAEEVTEEPPWPGFEDAGWELRVGVAGDPCKRSQGRRVQARAGRVLGMPTGAGQREHPTRRSKRMTPNDSEQFCPMHSDDWLAKAVRNNRIILDLPPQTCTCPDVAPAATADDVALFGAEEDK